MVSVVAFALVGLVTRTLASGFTNDKTASLAGLIGGGVFAVVGFVNAVLTAIKSSQEIELNRRKLADQNRRIVDAPAIPFKWGSPINLGVKANIVGESEEKGRDR